VNYGKKKDIRCTYSKDNKYSSSEKPFSFDVAEMEFVTREVVCPNCPNHCEVICVYRDGELIDSWGNRCERGEIKQGQE
jgi:hypothetical protein